MPRTNGLLSCLLMVAVTAGWGGCGQVVRVPQVQYVEVEKARDLPDSLLKPCPIDEPEKGNDSVREMRRIAELRKLSLRNCNNDKVGLKKLDPKSDKP